ncbi:MAG: N-methyl-L-tryptophan oxidase, partial [Chloroflexi bacterium]|nr:N-methyl-L-tryptophan oxidase [Chloroflexota bacterium]
MNGIPRHYDAIVIGVGGMGSATIYSLARRGKRVLGLEQFDVPHDLGSSHGYTRIIRLAYYEHPSYVMLLQRAYELWDEIERTSGEHLLHITGSIDAGPADSWVFKGSFQSCVEHELAHEVLTGKELAQRFPGYRLPYDHMALLQPRGGFLAPERCTVAFVDAAHRLGAEIHAREEVLGWEPLGDGVRVITNRDVYAAERLIITAGAWNRRLAPMLHGLAVPERQVLAWFQPRRPEYFLPENFPVFNLLVDEGRFYGFPVHGVPGFKVGKYHHFQEQDDPERLDRRSHDADELMLREFTDRYFPDASGPTMTLKSCLFTNTPDGHFIIDSHPQCPQVSFAAGFSGHGYKFASVIGEILGDLAIFGRTRHDISLFRHDRFRRDGSVHPYPNAQNEIRRIQQRERVFERSLAETERAFVEKHTRRVAGAALSLSKGGRWQVASGRRQIASHQSPIASRRSYAIRNTQYD